MFFDKPIPITIDIDGVLVNNFIIWKKYFNNNALEHGHKEIIDITDSPEWDYFLNICKPCWNHVLRDQGMLLNYPLIDGALEILTFLKGLGYRLHILSSRPPEAVEYTHQWAFDRFGLLLDSVNITSDKTGKAKELGAKYHIDDAPHHINSFNKEKLGVITMDHPYNSMCRGPRVENFEQYGAFLLWDECRK